MTTKGKTFSKIPPVAELALRFWLKQNVKLFSKYSDDTVRNIAQKHMKGIVELARTLEVGPCKEFIIPLATVQRIKKDLGVTGYVKNKPRYSRNRSSLEKVVTALCKMNLDLATQLGVSVPDLVIAGANAKGDNGKLEIDPGTEHEPEEPEIQTALPGIETARH